MFRANERKWTEKPIVESGQTRQKWQESVSNIQQVTQVLDDINEYLYSVLYILEYIAFILVHACYFWKNRISYKKKERNKKKEHISANS